MTLGNSFKIIANPEFGLFIESRTGMPIEDETTRRQRLRFRSWHRGTRELDLLLGSFADAHIAALPEAELDQFEALLMENDPDIYDWIIHPESRPPALHDNAVMQKLRAHRYRA